MTDSVEPESEQTELSTQDLPTIPTVQEMKTWDKEKVLRWIQQRDPNILEGDNLNTFIESKICGSAFLASSVKFYSRECGLPPGPSLALGDLVNEVKEGSKFIPWT